MKNTMKILVQFLFAIFLFSFLMFSASAAEIVESGTCGENLSWVLYQNGELVISGTGKMDGWAFHDVYPPWHSKASSITSVTIEEGVTNIGGYAFEFCNEITDISIPKSVTEISRDAFYCCTKLESITIHEQVKSIGARAFYGCSSLSNITVHNDNKYYSSDERGVLFNKEKNTIIRYPVGNEASEYTIPDSVVTIGVGAFQGNGKIDKVIMPDSVVEIESYAFERSNITDIFFSNNLKTIGMGAFEYSKLTDVILPDSVTSLGDNAFKTSNLKSITIPMNTSIGHDAFWGCAVTIYGYEESSAYIHALLNDIPFVALLLETEASEANIYVMGAQLRLDIEDFKTDMRFVIRIRKDFLNFNEITEYEGENVKFGSLVLPFENGYMVDGDKLSLNSTTSDGWSPAKVPAVNKFKEDETYVYYTVCITDIAVYERYYAVRPYVMISETKFIYGAQYQAANLHNVCVLAAEDFATRGGVPAAITNIFYKCGHDEIIGKFNDNEVSLPWQF